MIAPDDLGPFGPYAVAVAWAALALPHLARIMRARRAHRRASQ